MSIVAEGEEPDASTAVIRVRDTGIGIPRELLPHVFELFTQAGRTYDQSQGGLGIGLALVRNLVELHGGTVSAASDGPGKGSEFVLRLPAMAAGSRGSGDGEASSPAPGSPAAAPARRVLIVEDNEDAAETLAEILEIWGHEVRVATDGPAALESAGAYSPEVVLLDIGLPGMDGYEVARRLREAEGEGRRAEGSRGSNDRRPPESGIPPSSRTLSPSRMLLVALTGFGQQSARRRSEEAGFDLHLIKPVDHQELRRVLREVRSQKSEG
jgi:two-component system CheB/CheR fusion protein